MTTLRARSLAAGFVYAIALTCPSAVAQSAADERALEVSSRPADRVESYMTRLGLSRLVAEQLAERLKNAERAERVSLAERLGRLYVQLLSSGGDADEIAEWERRGRQLLRDVPEADSSELRLNLNKAVYLRTEEIVERGRLRLAEPAELQEAERQLRGLVAEFTEIASRSHRRVEALERLEAAGDTTEALVTELSDARRIRSLSHYFSGWCHYYLAYLTRSESFAIEAMKSFGWLLNSPSGRPATIDRLPVELLRYEHIARSAMGCGLAAAIRGNDGEAVRWLETVDEFPELPRSVRDQLLIRKLIVFGESKRWADMEQLVRRTRRDRAAASGSTDGPAEPLAVGPARLLAVITLEADRRIAGPQIEALARTALGDLVARQEVGQVLDLVKRFGTGALGDTGFIVHYVRGLIQYEQAREAHRAESGGADEPTASPDVANLYNAAAAMLHEAMRQPDSTSFRQERARAGVIHGRCAYFTGDLQAAAERFVAAWEAGGKADGGEAAREALWLAVIASDRAAKGPAADPASSTRRDEIAALYLASYPDSSEAARLILMQAAAGSDTSEDDAIRILSEVPRESPVYEPARRQVARMLYQKFRGSQGAQREAAAIRFIAISEEMLAAERRAAMGTDREAARAACEQLVLRVRQMLDVLLGGTSPDGQRAQAVLEVLDGVATYNRLDLAPHRAELTFRRVQIALAAQELSAAMAEADRLNALAGSSEFSAAADRLVYRDLARKWRVESDAGSPTAETTQAVVRIGRRVIDQINATSGAASLDDPAVVALYSTVSAAATHRAEQTGDASHRDLAIMLDESILRSQPRTESVLRRLARNAESAGKMEIALEAWRSMFSYAIQGSDQWFEARFNALRLLKASDAAKARDLLIQHKLLYPDYGPEPWGERLRELDRELGPTTAAGSGSGPAVVPVPGGGG